jgi:hypothetical protein
LEQDELRRALGAGVDVEHDRLELIAGHARDGRVIGIKAAVRAHRLARQAPRHRDTRRPRNVVEIVVRIVVGVVSEIDQDDTHIGAAGRQVDAHRILEQCLFEFRIDFVCHRHIPFAGSGRNL